MRVGILIPWRLSCVETWNCTIACIIMCLFYIITDCFSSYIFLILLILALVVTVFPTFLGPGIWDWLLIDIS